MDEGRGDDDRQPDDEQEDGETGEPLREAESLGEGLNHLQADPGTHQVNAQHLPQRAVMDLDDQALETKHR